mmetsp:Transcript_63074/g.104876  ORF Transcript_63074/g.104876 Transcript_63074/m.104876 type:complete len:478 (-) Transcript_63074:497-1930(-)
MAMRKERTKIVNKDELELMITEFTCKDQSLLTKLGKHEKVQSWKLHFGNEAKPMTIAIECDQSSGVGRQKVKVEVDGKKIFPPNSSKEQLQQSFIKEWPFRAQAKGIGETGHFEARLENSSIDWWYPCKLEKQNDDGTFKAILQVPDGYGKLNDEVCEALRYEDIREKYSMKPLKQPRTVLCLTVPNDDPMSPILTCGDQDYVMHFFSRATPNPTTTKKCLTTTLKVDKEHKNVTADVSRQLFQAMKAPKPRYVKEPEHTKTKKGWTFTLGPDVEHKVEVEKRWPKSGEIVTVYVDGTILVECSGKDLDCREGTFRCPFRFVGEKVFVFEVYEMDANGLPTETVGQVKHRQKYHFDCIVDLHPEEKGKLGASFHVGMEEFRDFEPPLPMEQCKNVAPLKMTCDDFDKTFGIKVPYKVSRTARAGAAGYYDYVKTNGITGLLSSFGSSFGWFFPMCTVPATIDGSDEDNMARWRNDQP